MFSFGAENAKATSRPFPVKEAVDNVELDKVEYVNAVSANGNNYEGVKFYFKRFVSGQTSYLADLKSPPKQDWSQERLLPDGTKITKEEDYNSKMREYVSYLRHIAFAFGVTEEDLTSKGKFSTFGEAARNFCDVLNERAKNKKVFLKTVKNKDGYTCLPTYIGTGFCSSMDDESPSFKYTDRELDLIENASKSGVTQSNTTASNQPTETVTQSQKLSSSDIDDLI
jgi:hypothetical protein